MTDRFRKIMVDYIKEDYSNHYHKDDFLKTIDDDINPHNDWGFDSVDITDMAMYLELRYCIEISDEEIVNVHNLGELCNLCEEKANNK